MRAVIAGAGSAGRRHLRNLRMVAPHCETTVWHTYGRTLIDADACGTAEVFSAEAAIATAPTMAIVACPASRHMEIAQVFTSRGIPVLIEKPIADDLTAARDFLRGCPDDLVLLVGYNFRFYRPLQIFREAVLGGRIGRALGFSAEFGRYLPDWRPGTDYRLGVTANRRLGGGVTLELSHELDYLIWMFGDPRSVSGKVQRIGDLEVDVEDTCDAILEFSNGTVGSVHLDMLQRAQHRSLRVWGTEGTLAWDGGSHCVREFSGRTGSWQVIHAGTSMEWEGMYIDELRHFLACVNGDVAPEVSGSDACRVLELALAIHESSRRRMVIDL